MTEPNTPDAVIIERTFAAPLHRVWQMWTDVERFKTWYGPSGASIPDATMDVRVGGVRRICMEAQTPSGPMRMWFVGEYVEVTPTVRLSYTESMADEHGNVVVPSAVGMPSDHPVTTQVTVELTDKGEITIMRLTHAGIPADSPGASGWMSAFDQLESRLAQG
jgi:uncharacterized protein YndB with AHSA1/START domain